MTELTDQARYDRQQRLDCIGVRGQQRLAGSTALLVGCGALGTVIADTLVRAGVGRLIICDRDFVEPSNLQRQVLFDEADARAGLPKAEAAKAKLHAINRGIHVDAVTDDVTAANAERLAGVVGDDFPRAEVILDGTDNFETRYLLNDVAVKHTIPFVYGGAVGTSGTAMVILPPPPPGLTQDESHQRAPWTACRAASPDLRDLWDAMPAPGTGPTCDTVGVLAPAVHTIASFQACEAIKVLTQQWQAVCPTLLQIDLWANTVRHLDVSKLAQAGAGICTLQRRFEFLDQATAGTTTLCGRDAVQLPAPAGDRQTLDLQSLAHRLGAVGRVQVNPFLLRLFAEHRDQPIELTVFADGRCIVKGTTDPAAARTLVSRWVGL